MIAIAFILFAILVVGWLVAPNGELKAAPAPQPGGVLMPTESPA